MGFKLTVTKKDIDNAVGGNFEPIPAGVYGSRITNAIVKDSSKGNPMYMVDHLIIEGATGIGRKLKSWHVIQGPGSFGSTNLLKALDFPVLRKGMTDEEIEDYEFPDPDELIGLELNIKLEVESYPGMDEETGEEVTRYRNNVKGTFKYDEDRHTELEEDDDSASGSLL